ncbi:hypothetical protein DAPPUDRAFT_124636, partial [Daphnia pulex]
WTVFLSLACSETRALARWDHRQADRLRDYRDLGLEFYNDSLSYRPPWHWSRENRTESRVAEFALGAGSLNQKEFLFEQRAAFQTSESEAIQLGYFNARQEDPTQYLEQDAIELSYKPEQSIWRYGILAEGYTEKAFVDLGLSIRRQSGEFAASSIYTLSAWWVDGLYESKKTEAEDKRSRNPLAIELGLDQGWRGGKIILQHSLETPVEWQRQARDQVYSSQAEMSSAEVRLGEDLSEYYLLAQREWRREDSRSLSSDDGQAYRYRRLTLESGLRSKDEGRYMQIALWGLASELQLHRSEKGVLAYDPERRRELAAFGSWHLPWGEGSPNAQVWGLFANRVFVRSDAYRISTEVKLQWAYEIAIGRQ